MEHKGLIPNESYEIFIIGDNITNYLHFPHILDHTCGNMYCYDSYTFPTLHFTVWVEDGRIDTICCDQVCYWKNTNLIGMPYRDFLIMCGQKPTKESKEYVLLSKDRGQNQKVYIFDDLSLTIWTWRNKIKTVLVYKNEDEE